jgi:hypothetical protein
MKSVGKVAYLLPLLLCACSHNANLSQVQPLAPPIEDTPPPPPDSAPANLPPPVITIPKSETPVVVVQEPPKPSPKHHKPPAKPSTNSPASAPAQQPTQVAAEAPPSEVRAIDQLSSTEPPNTKKQAEDSITEVEKGLTGINRQLSSQEEKTSTQIKEFLKQARTALASGDVEGAKTLAAKAKALLGELSQ